MGASGKGLQYGFLGLGLIGGSIARAIRAKEKNALILAYDTDSRALELATEQHIADRTYTSIDPAFGSCDVLFLCAPVGCNLDNLAAVRPYLTEKTILTDVGSTKSDIHAAVQNAGLQRLFIGGHPMTGSERVGFANSKPLLLENAYYILTPEPEVLPQKTAFLQDLVTRLGAIPLLLDAGKHDFVTAAVSHLPHVISASLVNLVQREDGADGMMKMIAAGGFKDITRISSSSPVMWQHICLSNTENILRLLDSYIDALQDFRKELEEKDEDRLYAFFDRARAYRDSFIDVSSGPIKKVYSIRVDISDEAGSIAAVAALLASHRISIKNIGIVHNREYEEGVLRIEFYEESAIQKARQLLIKQGYIPHSKE